MAVTLFTDRRMLDHRVPARHPERPERLQAILRHLERTGYLAACPSGQVREATAVELGRVHPAGVSATGDRTGSRRRRDARPGYLGFPGFEPGGPAGGRCVHRGGLVCHGREMTGGLSVWFDRRGTMPGRPREWGFASTPTSPSPRPKPSPLRRQPSLDRRFRCPPRQWHAGDLLRFRARGLSVDSSLSVLSGNRRTGRDRYRCGTRLHVEHPPTLWHVADGVPRGVSFGPRTIWPTGSRPELVLISAGFDAHAEDPVGDLGLEVEDFEILTQELVSVAKTHAGAALSACSRGATTCRFWPARRRSSPCAGRGSRDTVKPDDVARTEDAGRSASFVDDDIE